MRRATPSAGSISSSSTATQYRESEPPESLTDHHSFDCSSFDFAAMTTTMLSPSPSLTSSFNSLSSQESSIISSTQSPCSPPNRPLGSIKGWGSTLSRSRCVNNLSSFGGGSDSADVGVCSRRTIPAYNNKSGATDGWVYFVDTI